MKYGIMSKVFFLIDELIIINLNQSIISFEKTHNLLDM